MSSGPVDADAALEALRSGHGAKGDLPVTGLSVDEAVLVDQVGYEPVGLVTGASVVQLSAFARLGVGLSTNAELPALTDALTTSRRTAVERLTAAGAGLGAEGVMGVRFEVGDLRAGSRLVSLVLSGTAVRAAGRVRAGRPERCFTAAMSGQELHLAVRAGYRPLGIVSGVCAYHVGRRGLSEWAGGVRDNTELTVYTEALYEARELAMERLQAEALALGAAGVIGVSVTERTGVWGSHVIEFAAMGTAVEVDAGGHRSLDPQLVIDLSG